VLASDTPEALQKRVYEQELALYPKALGDFLATRC
jgi:folate-dependent phosphoribosylglycinamide formyltransferase PurN